MRLCAWALSVLGATLLALFVAGAAQAATYPTGFREDVLDFEDLEVPTAVAFAPDGAVFVAEKGGRVKRFASVDAEGAGQVVIDISAKVHDFADRGLIGLALHPDFATNRQLFILYTSQQALPGTRTFPDPMSGSWGNGCPPIPGDDKEGCVVSSKLSRVDLTASWTGTETQVLQDWCQQFSSHSTGTLAFGRDGQLYAGAGDGASFTFTDWGQRGGGGGNNPPINPCGDPPGGVGVQQVLPTAEGGALRSQDVRTPGDPTGLDGAIIRIDPATGAASAGNPYTTGDANRRRIIAYGLRNPFRFALRPGTDELYLGDVGWSEYEEVNRIADVNDGVVENFGWPCYEGPGIQFRYMRAQDPDLDLCTSLAAAAVTKPVIAYEHGENAFGESCPTGNGSSVGPISFYPGAGNYPARYDGGLFVGDYSRGCMWFVGLDAAGNPDPTKVEPFASEMQAPVDLKVGPGGDLYFADAFGAVVRLAYREGNADPVPRVATQEPGAPTASSAPPLTVDWDGRGTTDADDTDLAYAWDLDGDGAFDDSTLADPPPWTYADRGRFDVRLRVTDRFGGVGTSTARTVRTDNAPPTVALEVLSGDPYAVGDPVRLRATVTDPEDGTLPATALKWSAEQEHCTVSGCHTHFPYTSVESGAVFEFPASDHPYPSYYVVSVKATDADRASVTSSVEVKPRAAPVSLAATVGGVSVPGLKVGLDDDADATARNPHLRTEGATATLSSATEQVVGPDTYVFSSWGTGVAGSNQLVTVPPGATTYTARFDQAPRSTTTPSVPGAPREGQELTADLGAWVGHPAPALTVQWQRCTGVDTGCSDLAGATAARYRATAADVGSRLRVRVRGANRVSAAQAVGATTAAVAVGDAPAVTVATTAGDPSTVGGRIAFAGSATDAEDGAVPAGSLRWRVVARRCDAAGACTEVPVADGPTGTGEVTATDRPWRTVHVVTVTATDRPGGADRNRLGGGGATERDAHTRGALGRRARDRPALHRRQGAGCQRHRRDPRARRDRPRRRPRAGGPRGRALRLPGVERRQRHPRA